MLALIVKIAVPVFALIMLAVSFKLDEKKIKARLTPEQEKEFEIETEHI